MESNEIELLEFNLKEANRLINELEDRMAQLVLAANDVVKSKNDKELVFINSIESGRVLAHYANFTKILVTYSQQLSDKLNGVVDAE